MKLSEKYIFIKIISLLLFVLFPLRSICQTSNTPYDEAWKNIITYDYSPNKKIQLLDEYIDKAKKEKNLFEEYRALDLKTDLVSNDEAIKLSDEGILIGKKLKNDSLVENSLLTKAAAYFLKRNFNASLENTLLAQEYNLKTNSIYSLNSIKLDIGYIYYYTKNYNKAKDYFLEAANYYKTKDESAHLQSYVVSLYNLGKTYWQLNNIDSLKITIEKAKDILPKLDKVDIVNETPYIKYLSAGKLYLNKNYKESEQLFLEVLNDFKNNNDFTNEHVSYLYLGKIYWETNNKEKALHYFKKIDELFKKQKFLNYELRETYDYLIEYYKEHNNTNKQLEATEILIELNKQFEKEQENLKNTLHYDLEIKELLKVKNDLEKQIILENNHFTLLFTVSIVLILTLLIFALWKIKQKKLLKLRFETIVNNEIHFDNTEIISSKNITPINDTLQNITEVRILNELEIFENEKKFLQPIKLEELAKSLDTNRNTLSQIINKNKGCSFINYINRLRIKQLIIDLKTNEQLRKLNMQGLAETYGFSNVKTFTNQFKAETNLTPAYFIKQLENLNVSID